MNIKKCGLILLACVSASLSATNLIFLENESNGTIAYQVNTKQGVQYMNPGVRHFLGIIDLFKNLPPAIVQLLPKGAVEKDLSLALVRSLQISGSWMWSRYTSLNEYLTDIRATQKTACQLKGIRCSQNAIIRIKPSSIASGWKVEVTWEKSGKIEEFDMNSFK